MQSVHFESLRALSNKIAHYRGGVGQYVGAEFTTPVCYSPPLTAGWWHVTGNMGVTLPADGGMQLYNYHVDIGLAALNGVEVIETAPAGGSTWGDHVQRPGEDNAVIMYHPCGARNICIPDDGGRVVLRGLCNWGPLYALPTNKWCFLSGALNGFRIGGVEN